MPMRNRGAIGLQSFAWAELISGYRLLSSIAYNMPVLPAGKTITGPWPSAIDRLPPLQFRLEAGEE
jgi:hypothetical protein